MQETINYKRPTYSSAYTQGYQTSQINGRFSYEYFTSHRSHKSHKGTRAIACVRLRDVSTRQCRQAASISCNAALFVRFVRSV